MMMIRESNQQVVVKHLRIAEGYFERLRGLIGVKAFTMGDGLLFPRCNSIHMWMMQISIDVVFLSKKSDHQFEIIKLYSGLKPWKFLPVFANHADHALEVPDGLIKAQALKVGEVLCIAS